MNIENSIEKQEQKYYDESFTFYKYIKFFKPEVYGKIIVINAKDKELISEMGQELHKVFDRVLEEVTNKNKIRIEKSVKLLKESNKLSPEELKTETFELNKELIAINEQELRNDLRLRSAFAGKGKLLIRVIDFTSNSMNDLLELDKNIQH